MTRLNADAIITLTSAVPALFIASLSAWLAYLTLRRRDISRNDIETSTIEFILAHTSTASSSMEPHTSLSRVSTVPSLPSESFPQLQLPPAALLRNFERGPGRTRSLSPPVMSDERVQPANVGVRALSWQCNTSAM